MEITSLGTMKYVDGASLGSITMLDVTSLETYDKAGWDFIWENQIGGWIFIGELLAAPDNT